MKRRRKSVRRVRRSRSPRVRAAAVAPRRRRRARRLSAMGGNLTNMLMQAGLTLAGGVAGKVIRNVMPEDLAPEIKAAVTAGAGIAVGTILKQPQIGFGIVGSAGAYYASALGMKLGIPLLSAQETSYVRLSEAQIYADQYGNTLKRIGDQFFYPNGALSSFKPSDFKTIN
jgi:hypothetical protein